MFQVPNIPVKFIEKHLAQVAQEAGLGVITREDIEDVTQFLRFTCAITGRERLADAPDALRLVQEIVQWAVQRWGNRQPNDQSSDDIARESTVQAVLDVVQRLEQKA